MNPAKSSNPSKTDADRVNPGTPGQGQRPEAPPETPQDQAGGKAQSRAEDELDEGKRLRPKFNTNLDRLRRTGGISQEMAPDSARVESGTRNGAPDSTRAESGPIPAGIAPDSVDFAGSDPCFSSDSDRAPGLGLRGRQANFELSLNLDFLGSDPEFSDQNPEPVPDSGFRSLQGNLSPDLFSYDPDQVRGSGSGLDHVVDHGSGPENDPDLVPVSQPPLPDTIRSVRLSRVSLFHRRMSRQRPGERSVGSGGGERVAQANSSLSRPISSGEGGGEMGARGMGEEIRSGKPQSSSSDEAALPLAQERPTGLFRGGRVGGPQRKEESSEGDFSADSDLSQQFFLRELELEKRARRQPVRADPGPEADQPKTRRRVREEERDSMEDFVNPQSSREARILQNFESLTGLVQNKTKHNQNPERLLIYKKTRRDRGLANPKPGCAPPVAKQPKTCKNSRVVPERGSAGSGATNNSRLVARSGSGTTARTRNLKDLNPFDSDTSSSEDFQPKPIRRFSKQPSLETVKEVLPLPPPSLRKFWPFGRWWNHRD